MGRVQSTGNLSGNLGRLNNRKWSGTNSRSQVLTVQVRHRNKRFAFHLIDFENRANIGVIQRGSILSFSNQSMPVGLAHGSRQKKFERHESIEPQVMGFVNDAHTA